MKSILLVGLLVVVIWTLSVQHILKLDTWRLLRGVREGWKIFAKVFPSFAKVAELEFRGRESKQTARGTHRNNGS